MNTENPREYARLLFGVVMRERCLDMDAILALGPDATPDQILAVPERNDFPEVVYEVWSLITRLASSYYKVADLHRVMQDLAEDFEPDIRPERTDD